MLSSYRIPKLLLPFAVSAVLLAPPMPSAVQASPFSIPHGWAAAATKSIAEPVHVAGVVVAVVFVAAGAIVTGSIVAASLAGAFIAGLLVVVFIGAPLPGRSFGRRYYGGVYYGHERRYWHGRWWAYGVGSCWRITPDGYYGRFCG